MQAKTRMSNLPEEEEEEAEERCGEINQSIVSHKDLYALYVRPHIYNYSMRM